MAYEILREVSDWKVDYPCSHTYLLNGDKIVAYIKEGDDEINIIKSNLKIDKRYRKFIKIKHDLLQQLIPKEKDNNLRIFNVLSKDKTYVVELNIKKDRYRCNCTGFTYRGKCKHIDAVAKKQQIEKST